MSKKIITKYQCDCCGRESENEYFTGDITRSGSSYFKLSGKTNDIMFDGCPVGQTHSYDEFLCFECAGRLKDFYDGMKPLRHLRAK